VAAGQLPEPRKESAAKVLPLGAVKKAALRLRG